MHALSTRNDSPETASRPFSASRDGFVMGEGSSSLILEELEHALARGAHIYAEVAGAGMSADAHHITASHPDGLGAKLVMYNALEDAKMQPEDIDYINAHGTGTQNNDVSEGTAIVRVFNENIPPVSSTKSFTGHTTSAAGSVESVISILALQHDFIPANLNFNTPMPELSFTPVKDNITKKLHHVLSNSFGFGGNDSACIFSIIE